jgi:hypothetical protein
MIIMLFAPEFIVLWAARQVMVAWTFKKSKLRRIARFV